MESTLKRVNIEEARTYAAKRHQYTKTMEEVDKALEDWLDKALENWLVIQEEDKKSDKTKSYHRSYRSYYDEVSSSSSSEDEAPDDVSKVNSAWKRFRKQINYQIQTHCQDRIYVTFAAKSWKEKGGEELEPCLRSGAIALLDATWLIDFYEARKSQHLVPVLPRRQELPKEAFLSCDQVILSSQSPQKEGDLHIIALSYMWLDKSHPDPNGTTLELLVKTLKERLLEDMKGGEYPHQRGHPQWGLFWDYGSLFQHPNPSQGCYRTKQEDALFREGLDSLAILYSHPHTQCWKVTGFSKAHQQAVVGSSNNATYYERGWTFTESSWAGMTKHSQMVFDIGKEKVVNRFHFHEKGLRTVPLMPDAFEQHLQQKTFTNAKDDYPLVARLYRDHFVRSFRNVQAMDYSRLNWDCNDIEKLAEILRLGYSKQLKDIELQPVWGAGLYGTGNVIFVHNAITETLFSATTWLTTM